MDKTNEIINEVNKARTNPSEYSKKILSKIPYFYENILVLPNSSEGIVIDEGVQGYRSSCTFLVSQKPVRKVEPNQHLTNIAREFLTQIQQLSEGEIGKIKFEDIIKKYGTYPGTLARAIDFGAPDAEFSISNFIICDGDKSRKNRKNLFNNDFKIIGAACGKHKIYNYCTVVLMAESFDENEKSNGGAEDGPCLPPGVLNIIRKEKIIIENGKKKKIKKMVMNMEDGSKKTVITKEDM